MSVVSEIMQRNHVTITLDGIPYCCHRMSSLLMMEALGPEVLMSVIAGAQDKPKDDDRSDVDKSEQGASITQKVLRVAMISPKFGDVDDPEADTITWLSLGDHAMKLYNALMSGESKKIADFPESCAEKTDG